MGIGLVVHWLASLNIQAIKTVRDQSWSFGDLWLRAVGDQSCWLDPLRSGSHCSIRGRSGRPLAGVVEHPGGRVRAVRGSRSGSGRPTARCGVGLVVHWLASSRTSRRPGSGRPTAVLWIQAFRIWSTHPLLDTGLGLVVLVGVIEGQPDEVTAIVDERLGGVKLVPPLGQ